MTESPKILPSSPPRKTRIFGEFSPFIPCSLGYSHPQSFPDLGKECIPVPLPVFRGILGIYSLYSPFYIPKISCPRTIDNMTYSQGYPDIPRLFLHIIFCTILPVAATVMEKTNQANPIISTKIRFLTNR